MKRNERGVAGFFEDLPVLVFVLAGTLIIVLSALNVAEEASLRAENEELEHLADRCIELVISSIRGLGSAAPATVSSVCSTKLSQAVDGFLTGRGFSMSILMVHPDLEWLAQYSGPCRESPERVFCASRLVNAVMDDGRTAILVVRIVVW